MVSVAINRPFAPDRSWSILSAGRLVGFEVALLTTLSTPSLFAEPMVTTPNEPVEVYEPLTLPVG